MTEMEVKMEETNQSVKTLEAKVIYNEKTLVGTIAVSYTHLTLPTNREV